ncbi:unnamed protein product [Urochloa decumbens]|uniref:Uncharacterized protein n=1 Tax=Urochloa decumbens TaxID=240449 RepID=A0ABC8V8A9_9POAL
MSTGVVLPRIRIEYDYDRCGGAHSSARIDQPPPSSPSPSPPPPDSVVDGAAEEPRPPPPPRQLTDPPLSLGPVATRGSRRSVPDGDHMLLRAFKNKVDYCRVHGFDIFYSTALLDAELNGFWFWTKLPLLRSLMVAHPETEFLWWMDSDLMLTDMLAEPPWGRYARHNLVVPGWDDKVYVDRSWLGINAGSFIIRNCRWSLDLLDAWARGAPCGRCTGSASPRRSPTVARTRPATSRRSCTCSSRSAAGGAARRCSRTRTACTGSGPGSWTSTRGDAAARRRRARAAGHALRRMQALQRRRLQLRRRGMERALNFADDQVLSMYGFGHESLNTTAVLRVRNDTGGPLDADDAELGRLLHPAFRAANL